jgi:cob(I)alamin adenosyltransferase
MRRRIIVITGHGKGKTTSAIGSAIRALGRGYKVLFYQFIKSSDAEYGEHLFFKGSKKLKIVRFGLGCRKDFKYHKKDIEAAILGLKKIDQKLFEIEKVFNANAQGSNKVSTKSEPKSLVVLDEVSYPLIWNWFPTKDLIKLIDKYPGLNFILTGRDMPQEIIDIADTVSSVQEIKHAYQKGIQAQRGIEF